MNLNDIKDIPGIDQYTIDKLQHVTDISQLRTGQWDHLLSTESIRYIYHPPDRNIPREFIDKLIPTFPRIYETEVFVTGDYARLQPTVDSVCVLIVTQKITDYNMFLNLFTDRYKSTVIRKDIHCTQLIAEIERYSIQFDFHYATQQSKATMLLYTIGPKSFFDYMVQRARDIHGARYVLTQHDLTKYPATGIYVKKKEIHVKSEQDIFKHLNMTYINPHERYTTPI